MTVFMNSNFHCHQHFLHVISLIRICSTFRTTLDVRDSGNVMPVFIVAGGSFNSDYDDENWLPLGYNYCLINCRDIEIFAQNYYTEDSVIIYIYSV